MSVGLLRLGIAASGWRPLLLDSVPGASAAYSLRKLRAGYGGSALRVRRSSDNTEQDIGFASGILDTAALLTFAGAGSAFVATLYDQSGNGRNATQATAAAQPRLVNAGVLDTDANGRPRLVFDGADDRLNPGSALGITRNVSRFEVLAVASIEATAGRALFGASTPTLASARVLLDSTGTEYRFGGRRLDSNAYAGVSGGSRNNARHLLHGRLRLTDSRADLYFDGAALSVDQPFQTSTSGNTSDTDSAGISIGAYPNGTLFHQGGMQEMIVYAGVTADRTALQTDINAFWQVY